jgi:hypothetical protein
MAQFINIRRNTASPIAPYANAVAQARLFALDIPHSNKVARMDKQIHRNAAASSNPMPRIIHHRLKFP